MCNKYNSSAHVRFIALHVLEQSRLMHINYIYIGKHFSKDKNLSKNPNWKPKLTKLV